MDILLTQDELAILKWLHNRANVLWDESTTPSDDFPPFSPDAVKKALAFSDEQYNRAASFLASMKLLQLIKNRGMYLTAKGANVFRHAAKKEEWDITPEQFKEFRASTNNKQSA